MKKAAKKITLKYLTETTFEKHMRSIAKSFETQNKVLASHSQILSTHSQVLEVLLKEMKALHEDNKYARSTLSSFVGDVLSHDRKIDNLTIRVEKLEV